MVSMMQVLLPLVVSAIGIFVASSLIHMVFKWHTPDYRKLANEDEVAAALRKGGATPGQYVLPHCMDMKEMQSAEMQKKYADGPNGYVVLGPNGLPNIGKSLLQWFVLTLVVSGFIACICAAVFAPGAAPGTLLHVAGMIAFAAYGAGSVIDAIWFARAWGIVAKDLLDALIYAAITGASFALLWPAA